MKHILKITSLLIVLTCGTGCTTAYLLDRGRDAADVFTCTVGVGVGVKAKAGPVESGLILQGDSFGLRGGTTPKDKGKSYDLMLLFGGFETYKTMEPDTRNKEYQAFFVGPLICLQTDHSDSPPHVYTQIEVVVGLGPSLRLGFNPGEFLDLFLGFAGIDIYNDDLERRKLKIEQENSG